jgi:hypothetical protein
MKISDMIGRANIFHLELHSEKIYDLMNTIIQI